MTEQQAATPQRSFVLGDVRFGAEGVSIEVGPDAARTPQPTGSIVTSGGGRDELLDWARRYRDTRWKWFYAPLAALLKRTKLRFVLVSFPDRVGHLAAELDMFLKQRALGLAPNIRPVMLLRRDLAANRALLDHWSRGVTILSGRWAWKLLSPLLLSRDTTQFLGEGIIALDKTASHHALIDLWGDRGPVLPLEEKTRRRGRAWLESLGVPKDGWFVTIHAREPGYSPRDEHIHRFRNVNIDSYRLAVAEIVKRGGHVVRIGDRSMKPLKDFGPNVVDLALMQSREEWMDLFLCAENRFFLGNTSGPFHLAKIFDKPCVLTNMIPYGCALGPTAQDLSIPKLLLNRENRPLRFDFIFRSHASRMRNAIDYRENNLAVRPNTPEQIRDVTVEMLDRLEGTFETTEADEAAQARFRGMLQSGDYSFGAPGRVGRDFLRQYAHLL